MFGEHTRAISTLKRLLQTPCQTQLYGPAPITSAFLTLDPLWDDLRGDPAFQELCQEKELRLLLQISNSYERTLRQ